jgi:DNA polymerase/3'-5' exonuclease PolX
MNDDIAEHLSLIAGYYDYEGNIKNIAYKKAASQIRAQPERVISGTQVQVLPSIGPSISKDIDEFLVTGTSTRLESLQESFEAAYPGGQDIVDYFDSLYGVGPSTALKWYQLGYTTLYDVWTKVELTSAQRLGILWRDHLRLRLPRAEMEKIRSVLGSYLAPLECYWEMAGSYRRQESSSGDVDILVRDDGTYLRTIIQALNPILVGKLAQGPTKYMGIVRISPQDNAHRIDIRLIKPESYAYALMYFTGSQRFNILTRQRAIELGLRLNEYGLFDEEGQSLPGESEEEIFDHLGLVYVAPKNRSNIAKLKLK